MEGDNQWDEVGMRKKMKKGIPEGENEDEGHNVGGMTPSGALS